MSSPSSQVPKGVSFSDSPTPVNANSNSRAQTAPIVVVTATEQSSNNSNNNKNQQQQPQEKPNPASKQQQQHASTPEPTVSPRSTIKADVDSVRTAPGSAGGNPNGNSRGKGNGGAAPLSNAVALALEFEATGGANNNKSSAILGIHNSGASICLDDEGKSQALPDAADEAFRANVKKSRSDKEKQEMMNSSGRNSGANGSSAGVGSTIRTKAKAGAADQADLINDGTSSHGRSSQGSSSHNDKVEQVKKLLSIVPGKDRDDMLMKDADNNNSHNASGSVDFDDDYANLASDSSNPNKRKSTSNRTHDPNKLEHICDELEEFAADSEKMKRFYEETLDQPFTGVVVIEATSQTIVYVNSFACFLFNRVESDLIGQDVCMLMGQVPGRDNKTFHHRKISNFLSTWAQKGVMPDSKIASGRMQELVCTRFEGIKKVPFTAQMVVRPIKMTMPNDKSPPAAFVGFFKDYTAEKALKSSLSQNLFTMNSSSEPVIVLDTYGTIREINKAACKLFGFSEKFLVKSEANIKLFMPESTAREHDRYLKTFREKLRTPGFDIKTSPIISKERVLTARRADGSELLIELRVELHIDPTRAGNDRLVGYIRDRSALIKAQDFNLEVSKRLFPESIAKIVSQKTDIRLVETYKHIPVILIDICDFIGTMRALDNEGTFDYLTAFFNHVAERAADFQIEIIKTNADGVIGVAGIDEFDDRRSRLDRVVCFGLEVLRWCQDNERQIRIGVGFGDLGSAVFEISKGRPTFDIWSSAINFASRCEKYADPQTIQITAASFKAISEPTISQLFKKKVYDDGIKGMQEAGESLTLYQTPVGMDYHTSADETERIKAASLSRLYLKKENARQLKEQQERRALTLG